MTHRRLTSFAAVAALAWVLAACQITITPGPTPTFPPSLSGSFDAEVFVPTSADPPEVQVGSSLSAQQTRYYRVDVPTARDLLYAEVGGNDLRVTLYTTGGTVRAVSESSRYFGPDAASVAAVDTVGTTSLSTTFFCLGPCAAIEPTASSYVIGVQNLANSPRTFDLYAYTMTATDESEPNDGSGNATSFGAADDPTGAIEALGDEDWYVYTGVSNQTLRFTVWNLDLDLVLEFPNDEPVTLVEGTLDGTTTPLFPGDVFRVYSRAGLAGPSTESRYQITLE
jgi:hypothetical protein